MFPGEPILTTQTRENGFLLHHATLDSFLMTGIRRIINNIHERYDKQCHSQTHATVGRSHTGLKKEVDSQSAKQGKAFLFRTQHLKVGEEKRHSCKSRIAYPSCVEKLACRIVFWCTNSTSSLSDCAIVMALACIASYMLDPAK